jgi:tetratricopeptide (TPR) repeat protein
MYQSFINKFNTISFTIIMVLCALLPVFFLPITWGGVGAVKGVLLYIAVFVAFSFWLLAQFVGGSLKLPKHRIFVWLGVWLLVALISGLLSANTGVSLWGRGFVIDSFATVLVLTLFTFLVATFAREQKRLVTLFLAAFVGSAVTVLLQVVLYLSQKFAFVSQYLAHVANQGTLVGSWVDFAYFTTFTFILALLIYEVLVPKGFFKILSLSTMILSTIVLIFLNFKAAWIIAIVSALLVFVYKSSVERSVAKLFATKEETAEEVAETSTFPVMSFVALLIGLFFFLSSNSIGAGIARSAGVTFSDIRPSIGASMDVMGSTLKRDPIFGAGAGRFGEVWNLYHPLGINQTQFWNNSFDGGYSLFTTLTTTGGILTGLSVLGIIILSLVLGFRLFNYQFPDRFSRFIAVSALIMFVAFVGLLLFSSPGMVLIVFGFLYLGVLLGVSSLVGKIPVVTVNYLRDPRLSFFAILLLVVATMGGFTAAYFSGNRFASVMLYNRAITATSAEGAQKNLDRALSLSQNDIYWRTRAALFARQFTVAASETSPDKSVLQNNFTQAEQSARAAVAWDGTNANNWLSLSQVYQLVATTEAVDAYEAAKASADQAQTRNPSNPFFVLNQAQVALTKKDTASALALIARAIELKPDYLDTFVLRAQIRTTLGESRAVIGELSGYIKNAPYDAQGYFLLGQAYTSLKEYSSALDAFSRARQLAPADPNTSLAVIDTLTSMGQKSQALEALEVFATTFPGVTGIEQKRAQIQSAVLPSVAPVEEEKKS